MDGSDEIQKCIEVVGAGTVMLGQLPSDRAGWLHPVPAGDSAGTTTAPATEGGALWLAVLGATVVEMALGAGWWFGGWRVGWFALAGALGVLVTVALIVTVAVYDAWHSSPRWVVLVKRARG